MTFAVTTVELPSPSTASGDPAEGRRPSRLSPSGASLFRQCPRRWKFRYLDRLPDPPGEAALAGTFAHRVLELLLTEPPALRTIERAREIARDVWPETADDPDYQALGLDDEAERHFRWRGWLAVEGLWAIEDPTTVGVDSTEFDVEVDIGGVPFRGIVDRIDLTDHGRVISDYKSGRAPSARYAADRLSQVLLYAAAVHAHTGAVPARARLLYLGQKIVDIAVTEENLAEAVDELRGTWNDLNAACDDQQFDANTGPLCGWCPFVDRCREGTAEVRKRVSAGRLRLDAPGVELVAADEAAALADLVPDIA